MTVEQGIDFVALVRFAFLAAACGYLLLVSWQDWQTQRIRNRSVLVLVLLFFGWSAASGFEGIAHQAAAGSLLFVLGGTFWALGLVGAGDAKLLFPVGLFLGWGNLMEFAIVLLVLSVVAYILVKLPVARRSCKMEEIRRKGTFPYGVAIGFSAVIALLV